MLLSFDIKRGAEVRKVSKPELNIKINSRKKCHYTVPEQYPEQLEASLL
jgi:hypothetical protein